MTTAQTNKKCSKKATQDSVTPDDTILSIRKKNNKIEKGIEKKRGSPRSVPAAKFAALCAAGVKKTDAMDISGHNPYQRGDMLDDIEAMRAKIRSKPGYTLSDSADIYHKLSKESDDDSNKIRARGRLDAILGHDAPVSNTTTTRTEIVAALAVLSQLSISPMQALNELIAPKEIDQ